MLPKEDHLIDAYCGVGTIGFAFAKKVKTLRVYGCIQKPLKMLSEMLKEWDLTTHCEAGTAGKRLFLAGKEATERML